VEKHSAPEAASPPRARDGEDGGAGRLGPEKDGEDPAPGGRADAESPRDGEFSDDGGEGEIPDSLEDSNAAAYRRGFDDGYRAAIEGRHSADGDHVEDLDPSDDCLDDQRGLQLFRRDIPNDRPYR
jgi:hypothetical protein